MAALHPQGAEGLVSVRSARYRSLALGVAPTIAPQTLRGTSARGRADNGVAPDEAGWLVEPGLAAADQWLDLLAAEPKMLRRPLITDGTHLVVGWNEAALRAAFG